MSIQGGEICWINGSFPAGEFSDINIFRRSLKLMLLPQERVEAGKGYRGEYNKVDLPNEGLPKKSPSLQRYAKTRIQARHENVNGRFKQFNCIKNVWRHDLAKHKMTFRSVAVLIQLGLQYERGLFKVDYKTFNVKKSLK